jgi:hypothetical protein
MSWNLSLLSTVRPGATEDIGRVGELPGVLCFVGRHLLRYGRF